MQENINSNEVTTRSRLFNYYEKYMLTMGILGQFLFYVQGVKIFATKSAGDVSLIGFVLGFVSVSSWLIYGVLIKNKVLIAANAFAVIGALFVITGILIHG